MRYFLFTTVASPTFPGTVVFSLFAKMNWVLPAEREEEGVGYYLGKRGTQLLPSCCCWNINSSCCHSIVIPLFLYKS